PLHETPLAKELPTIPPLPFRRGEGRGEGSDLSPATTTLSAWMPWVILTGFILVWGLPQFKTPLDKAVPLKFAMPHLHNIVQRVPPVAPAGAKPETAEFRLNLLSATGTAILLAAITAGLVMGFGARELARTY